MARSLRIIREVHADIEACRACDRMVGTPVHGAAMGRARVMLVGQAPGPREARFGRPFAWTAGKTLFRWLEEAVGAPEEQVRARIYMAAVARCFPGKAGGGGDRKPDAEEIARCSQFLAREVAALQPELVVAVGTLAISQVLGERAAGMKLDALVGRVTRCTWQGRELDVIPLPHPSGASPWHKVEPGKALLAKALRRLRRHPAMVATLAGMRV